MNYIRKNWEADWLHIFRQINVNSNLKILKVKRKSNSVNCDYNNIHLLLIQPFVDKYLLKTTALFTTVAKYPEDD